MPELTPMMKQYQAVKEEHPDCLLFFRLGDFYEMFCDDAVIGSEELGLTLTTRDRNKPEDQRTPMCGVPYHSAEAYIARLIKRGYKIAICEQTEDPALAKGLVERDVVRIVTPGTAMGDAMLDESRNNYICAVCMSGESAAAALCDLSTGQFRAAPFQGRDWLDHLQNQLSASPPSEAILSPEAAVCRELTCFLRERLGCVCQDAGAESFELKRAVAALASCSLRQDGAELPADEGERLCCRAAGALAAYLTETQKTDLSHLGPLELELGGGGRMELDLTARRNLELTETLRGKEKRGSLLWVLDRTRTAMGHRLIRSWLERPLRAPADIRRRQDAVAVLIAGTEERGELAGALRAIPDLERLISKVVYGSANARDMKLLGQGLAALPGLAALIEPLGGPLEPLTKSFSGLEDLQQLIDSAIRDDDEKDPLPLTLREGGFIRPGYHAKVDHFRDVMHNGANLVADLERRERERTGIKTLKARYNKVFGYYLEVSRAYYGLVPSDYIRKQTLANCERFVTQELKDLEHEILTAQNQVTDLEYRLFCQLRETVAEQVRPVQKAAGAVACLDVLRSYADVAVDNNYCRPVVDDGGAIRIREGRHPVVEKMLKDTPFVPNDTDMDLEGERLALITGPNMAGKSTYMRQVALIVLMAQMGSYVPASSAQIGAVDRVFTRIGASDDLAAGQSTFMVEMSEVAEMLKNATPRSLLLLDEIGRGTSTYDGMAIARAVLEYCAGRKRLGAKTLFATHYHELTAAEGEVEGVKNYHIAAKKRGDKVVFLRKIIPGGADRSYGVEVARLAGVPGHIVSRAGEILKQLEAGQRPAPPPAPEDAPGGEQEAARAVGEAVLEELREVKVDAMTPMQALNLLYRLKQTLDGTGDTLY